MMLVREVMEVVSNEKSLFRLSEEKVVEYYDPTGAGKMGGKMEEGQ